MLSMRVIARPFTALHVIMTRLLGISATPLPCAGTWEGIQAAKQLEEQGVATHIILVYR